MRYQRLIAEASVPLWTYFEDADCKGDFSFSFETEITEDTVIVSITPTIESSFLKSKLEAREIKLAVALSCRSTYEYSDIPIGFKDIQDIELKKGDFFGRVHLTMIAYSLVDGLKIDKKELQGLYQDANIKLDAGTILAVSNEEFIDFSQPPRPLDVSFFELALSEELPETEYQVIPGSTRVTISAGTAAYQQLVANRGVGHEGQLFNLSSVYFSALLSLLYEIKEEPGPHIEKPWFNGIVIASGSLGSQLEVGDFEPLELAQKIFESPFIVASKSLGWEA